SYSPDFSSDKASTSRGKHEMKQRSNISDTQSRPRSVTGVPMTPTYSDYSFTQLSIPSPGGFFSSLQGNSRSTWCMGMQPKGPSAPSSAIAENFYSVPFKRSASGCGGEIETILEVPDAEYIDGPPTARQAGFDVPAEYKDDELENDDMYGAEELELELEQPIIVLPKSSPPLEYDDTYQHEIKQAAAAHIDRTSDWLCQQNSYLSALRESNPVNDPDEYVPITPNPLNDEEIVQETPESTRKAVRFLEEASKSLSGLISPRVKPLKPQHNRDSAFLDAFQHCTSRTGQQDAFQSASTRLDSVNTARLALPLRHVHSLLNTHTTETLQTHTRPRYRGPFNQNPRATGMFMSKKQTLFAEAERKQLAIDHILPAMWMTEAQKKVYYEGQLLACHHAAQSLTEASRARQADGQKCSLRVLDLGGAATGSWAWSAAKKWPNIKVITAQSKLHAELASQWPLSGDEKTKAVRPENPANHKVITVPQLWQLPFRDNHFDVISARTLHMFLKSHSIAASDIDEWDLTLKECMRVLKPGGILDFVLLDSRISNNHSNHSRKHTRDDSYDSQNMASISPTAAFSQSFKSPLKSATFVNNQNLQTPQQFNFERELGKRGYDADGGAESLLSRLSKAGFSGIRKQNIALPLGRTGQTHDNPATNYGADIDHHITPVANVKDLKSKIGSIRDANGRSRTPFREAPRPISEVSSITRIIEQYSNVEAVHGPVGSTADVADMAGLLGSMMWEEWVVRLRLETQYGRNGEKIARTDGAAVDANFEAANLLVGINEILANGYAKGGCFKAVIGWTRKPSRKAAQQQVARAELDDLFQIPIQRQSEHEPELFYEPRPESVIDVESYLARAQARQHEQPGFAGYPQNEATTHHGYYGNSYTTPTEAPLELD
ncbi:hypothetical protein LTR66_016143, partial [Elasticomyces elasticus]